MLPRGRVLEQGNETWRHSCEIDRQRIELRLTGDCAANGQLGQFVEGELIDGEIAFKTLDR